MLVPPWLESLLSTDFFSVCRTHRDAARSEQNLYCLDCAGEAFCYYCRAPRHMDHRVIQIRRSSYHDVVRVGEIQTALDIRGVQTYVINSARVLFLNERPQPRSGKGGPHACEICGRSLLDPFRFCSLGCKLAGIKRNIGNTSFILDDAPHGDGMDGDDGLDGKEKSTREEDELREGISQETHIRTPQPLDSSNSRRRKGIPHRAPFASSSCYY